MFKQQETQKNIKEAETIIGPSVKVKGEFNSEGNVIIEGELEGSITTNKNIFIGDEAKINGNIKAKEARIGGVITGNIIIKNHAEIVKSAKIKGDIQCFSLSIKKGASLNGNCLMQKNNKKENNTEKNI